MPSAGPGLHDRCLEKPVSESKKPVDALCTDRLFWLVRLCGAPVCHHRGRFCDLPRGATMFADECDVAARNTDIVKKFTRGMTKHFGVAGDLGGFGPFSRQKGEPTPDRCARNRRNIGGGDEGVICDLCWHDAGSLVRLLIRGRMFCLTQKQSTPALC